MPVTAISFPFATPYAIYNRDTALTLSQDTSSEREPMEPESIDAFLYRYIPEQLLQHREQLKERFKKHDVLVDMIAEWLVKQTLEAAREQAMERLKEFRRVQENEGKAEDQS